MELRKNEKQATNLQVVMVNDERFAIEERNGNISFNLTMMSKKYGRPKSPGNWLRTDEAQRYLKALTVMQKCDTVDLVDVRQGGTPEKQGTWTTDYRIAMRFAQWLDMDFAIAVDELIHKVLTGQAVVLEPKRGVMPVYFNNKKLFPYRDTLEAFGRKRNGNVSRRKARYPQHFVNIFGRNFITEQLFDHLAGYYDYVNYKQLTIDFGGQDNG